MIKRGFICYASVFQCGSRICSIKSMERYIECGLVGLVYACSCLSMFIIISFLGQMVKCVEFLCYLLSAESGAQMTTCLHCSGDIFLIQL
jgi:hypothetical protein